MLNISDITKPFQLFTEDSVLLMLRYKTSHPREDPAERHTLDNIAAPPRAACTMPVVSLDLAVMRGQRVSAGSENSRMP